MNPLYANLPTTIFETMSARARATGAINLGQGFPDGRGPADVLAEAARALLEESNQYPPMAGLPELRGAVAAHYARHQQLDLTPEEVVVTSGATEALAACILALVSPGDEVVVFEPLYDSYLPMIAQAGGIARIVTLAAPDWQIGDAALSSVFSKRTRLVIVNTPHNPTASMLDTVSLDRIADYCRRFDAVALCDEVWEHVVFDDAAHQPLISRRGMRERTVKIGSAGKIFALTGWKVGWICAAPALLTPISRAHQFLTFTTPPNLQRAAAFGLAREDSYFTDMRKALARSRDRLRTGLEAGGYVLEPSRATYFISIDLAASGLVPDDRAFCDTILEDGVAAIPVSAFYASRPATNHVRLCFSKADDVLDVACTRLIRARLRTLG